MPTSVYAVTTFLSAFLLFAVQPMLAKAILPWFGGTAAVWTVCLMFFQALLLLGYLYAHASSRYLPPKAQPFLHLALLALSLLWLPALPDASWKPTGGDDPTLRIVRLLFATVGLPYLLLSSTGSLLQAWYVRQRPDLKVRGEGEKKGKAAAGAGVYPYWLYAVSNTGSLLALLSYPVGVEPLLALPQQAWVWSGGYVLFALLCGGIALGSLRGRGVREATVVPLGPAPTAKEYLLWGSLVFCSTTLLLSITTHLTQNIAPVPFLWVVPLSLYLLSFILVFGAKGWRWNVAWLVTPPLAFAALAYGLASTDKSLGLEYQIPLYTLSLFVCCMVCHGELSRTKPDPAYLTSYYLMVSVGGALGGVFVGLIAPLIFRDYYELHLSIALCAAITFFRLYVPEYRHWKGVPILAAGGALLALIAHLFQVSYQASTDYQAVRRNFYGVLKTYGIENLNSGEYRRFLVHGTTEHGIQIMRPEYRQADTTTYYGPYSGVALALADREGQRKKVGVVGLGTGTLAAYAAPGDVYRFYEINPLVFQIAQKEFTFLKNSAAEIEIITGDARLSLEREPSQQYDVLAVDAFSSDSIPVHLLTREALRLYFRHLKPDGILAIHVSNHYLSLEQVVQRVAEEMKVPARMVISSPRAGEAISGAMWVLLTHRPGFFDSEVMKRAGQPLPSRPDLRVWTDSYSNLFQILK